MHFIPGVDKSTISMSSDVDSDICWDSSLAYQVSNCECKKDFAALFTEISSGCNQLVQLAGTSTD